MGLVIIYSFLLLGGAAASQMLDLEPIRNTLTTITMICLSYIMVEVGLEFTLNKKKLKSYGWDYIVAATAAAFPWIICIAYFMIFFKMGLIEASLLGRFAAPTSAGILFTMMAAAGLGTTWLFRKARILAIFDDLDTILFMIPLQILFVGPKPHLIAVVFIMAVLLVYAYRYLHVLHWPTSTPLLLVYGSTIVFACQILEKTTHVALEILLPTFLLGCILYNPHDPNRPSKHKHEHMYLEPEKKGTRILDLLIKGGFMFLVGCSLPKIALGEVPLGVIAMHVVIVTVLINVGKCFPTFCYRKEASFKERMALSVAMFPRGEVGAGVLLISLGHGVNGLPVTIAVLSLALNLLLTGVFIMVVIWLVKDKVVSPETDPLHKIG